VKTSLFSPSTRLNPEVVEVVETSQEIVLPAAIAADVKVIEPPKQTNVAFVTIAVFATGLTIIATGFVYKTQVPEVTLARYQTELNKLEAVIEVGVTTILLVTVLEL
jgi:hypothetical protein